MADRESHSDAKHYHVFLDECGSRQATPQPAFPFFSVAAVVVERESFKDVVRPGMDALKRRFWPERTDVVFHEPNMRRHRGKFHFDGDKSKQNEFDGAYTELLRSVPMGVIAAVLDKARLQDRYGNGRVDEYLPNTIYALAYTFVIERVCNYLHFDGEDGIGTVFPESVGKKEDANLQLHHARIFVEGTRYVPSSWLQYQLRPGLHFYSKGDNPGIELADTVARACAEHASGLRDLPMWWDTLQAKLYCGHLDRVDKWGTYKIFPPKEKRA